MSLKWGMLTPKQLHRFMAKVLPQPTGCWVWLGARAGGGYPVVSLYDRNKAAHRVSYEHFVGPVPEGLQLDHLCRVRACVNPTHVEPVTPRVNTLRGETPAAKNLAKTHCPLGHPYNGVNLYVAPSGERQCNECRRNALRRSRARRKAGASVCL